MDDAQGIDDTALRCWCCDFLGSMVGAAGGRDGAIARMRDVLRDAPAEGLSPAWYRMIDDCAAWARTATAGSILRYSVNALDALDEPLPHEHAWQRVRGAS